MRNKYGNRKIVTADGKFDSSHEYQRWCELKLLERCGKISHLKRQEKYLLIPAQYETYERISEKTGKKIKDGRRCLEKECSYVADFVYFLPGGELVVEDAKGVRTEAYIIKRKLMLQVYGIKISEV